MLLGRDQGRGAHGEALAGSVLMAAVQRGIPWPESPLEGAAGPTQGCAGGPRLLQALTRCSAHWWGAKKEIGNDQFLRALPPDTLSQGRWMVCRGWQQGQPSTSSR